MIGKWQYTGDVDALSYGGKWIRETSSGVFQIIRLDNMDEACGRDNEGQSRYHVDLSVVDLNAIPAKTIEDARESCGATGEVPSMWVAEACHSYGASALMWQDGSDNAHKLLRAARSEAHALARDAAALAERMDRPVNKIGSTAAEMMRGDIDSAINRGLAADAGTEPHTVATILAKMQDACTIPCPTCHGNGRDMDPRTKMITDGPCPTCKGRGKVTNTIGGLVPARKDPA